LFLTFIAVFLYYLNDMHHLCSRICFEGLSLFFILALAMVMGMGIHCVIFVVMGLIALGFRLFLKVEAFILALFLFSSYNSLLLCFITVTVRSFSQVSLFGISTLQLLLS